METSNQKKPLILKFLKTYFEESNLSKIEKVFEKVHPNEIYNLEVRNWKENEVLELFSIMNSNCSAKLFVELPFRVQEKIIDNLSKKKLNSFFQLINADELANIFTNLPRKKLEEILNESKPSIRKGINNILKYKNEHVGRHMTLDYVKINKDLNIKETKENLKVQLEKSNKKIAGLIYVTDSKNKLVGYVTSEKIFVSQNEEKVSDLMKTNLKSLYAKESINEAFNYINKYNLISLPIINTKNKLIGVVEPEDIVDIFNDMSTSVNLENVKKEFYNKTPYSKQSVKDLFKSRITWLVILLFLGIASQLLVVGFQTIWDNSGHWDMGDAIGDVALSGIITLAFSTSLSIVSSINDSAGNSGGQTLAVIIRAIGTGDISNKDFNRILKKEAGVGSLIGMLIGVLSIFRTFFVWAVFKKLNGINAEQFSWLLLIATIAAFSFFVSIFVSNITSVYLPKIILKFKKDPAVISGPVHTTIIDIFSIGFYLGMTTAIFIPLSESGIFS